MHELDCEPSGFRWIDCNDAENSVLSFLRLGRAPDDELAVVFNFTPVPRHNYQIGVPRAGHWQEVLNSDAPLYGGSGQGNFGGVTAAPISKFGQPYMLTITVPPLGVAVFRSQ
jgi:1,4-alpha-glucan branching enzyme